MADVQSFRFNDDGETPNNPRLPMLVYRAAVDLAKERDPAVPFERTFARHGWTDGWRNGIYSFLHFHTTAHEVLGIARGRARVEFGGASGRVALRADGEVKVMLPKSGADKLIARIVYTGPVPAPREPQRTLGASTLMKASALPPLVSFHRA